MPAQVQGTRNTTNAKDSGGTTQIVRQIDDQLVLLEPNETPLITLLMKTKKRFPVYTTQFEWLEDDFVARWASINDGTAGGGGKGASADTDSTVVVDDATKFVVGDTACLPNAASSSTAPEVVLVTAVNTGTGAVTFKRGIGGTTKTTWANGASIRILGPAYGEGDTAPESKVTQMVRKVSPTQIFRTSVKLTKTQAAVKQYGKASGERKYEQKKKLIEHKIKMNSAALFGVPDASFVSGSLGNLTGAGGGPLRTTMGLNYAIQSNVTTCGSGVLDKKTFESFARQAFRYGKSQKLLIASPTIISAIHDWGNSFLLVKPGENLLGVDIERVQTGHGTFLLCRDWMLENGIAGQNGFGGMAFAVDMDEVSYFYLNNNGENRDTHLMEDVVKSGADAYVDEILTEGGFAVKFEKKHAKLLNVQDYVV